MSIPNDVWPQLGKYVYLKSLLNYPPDNERRKLANQLQQNFNFKNTINKNSTQTLTDTINFAIQELKIIRDNERRKEQAAITAYYTKINKYKDDQNIPIQIRDKLQQQSKLIQSLNQNQYTADDIQQEQFNLIAKINIISQDLYKFKRRLQQLSDSAQDTVSKQNPLNVQSRQEYRREDNVYAFLRDLSRKKIQTNNRHSNRDMNKIIIDILDKDPEIHRLRNKYNKIQLRDHYQLGDIIYGIIFTDFYEHLANSFGKEWALHDLTEQEQDTITTSLKNYISNIKNGIFITEFQRTIAQQLSNINTILDKTMDTVNNFESFFGINFTSSTTYKAAKQGKNLLDERTKKGSLSSQNNEILQQLIKKFGSEKAIRDIVETYSYGLGRTRQGSITFRSKTSQSAGFFEEFIEPLQKGGTNISANAATDSLVPIATFTFSIDQGQETDILTDLSRNIDTNILGPIFSQARAMSLDNFQETVKKHQELNNEIQSYINNTINSLNKITTDFSESFIAYESLKLYSTYEKTGQAGLLSPEFTGRNIKILTALAELYASNELQPGLVDLNILILFILNISNAAMGSHNKDRLEEYLSLFAGLLMFDDIANLAKEAFLNLRENLQIETTKNNISQLHLLKINTLYFPLSVILDNLITQISDTKLMDITYERTARAELNPPKKDQMKLEENDNWDTYANKIINNTYITIHFLAGFSDYVKELAKLSSGINIIKR